MNSNTASEGRTDEIDLLLLWRAIWRFKYYLFIGVLFGAGMAIFVAYTAPELYRAEVALTEARESDMGGVGSLASRLGGLASLAGVNLSTASGGQEARALLESRRLVEEFIVRNNLVPLLMPSAGQHAKLWFAVLRFKNDILTIREDVQKHVITVAINWGDPVVAARWANDFVALANEMLRARALAAANHNIEYLNSQLANTNVVEMRQAIYGLVESETKMLMVANGRLEYAFTVVDPAVPPHIRDSPKRTIILALGVITGLFLGALAAFLRAAWLRHGT